MKPLYSFICTTLAVTACFIYLTSNHVDKATGRGSQRAAEIDDLVRLQDRIEHNSLFELSTNCAELCRREVEKYITNDLNCTDVRTLDHLDMVEARCSPDTAAKLSADVALAKFPATKVAHQYKNKHLHVPEEPPRSKGSMAKVPRDVQRKMQQRQWAKTYNSSLRTTSRVVHSVDWGTWHLDRIDQYDGYQTFDSRMDLACFGKQGAGSTVYVLDTGCLSSHDELSGRTTLYSERFSTGVDDNGHGTHVAGLAAGERVGVCKKCKVMCLKVMGADGSGSFSDVVDAMEHVMSIHDPKAGRGVVVMSLAGLGNSFMFDQAVKSLYEANIIPVVAAGNYNKDACSFTPANINEAVTVGGSTAWDTKSDISNYGQCIDIMSPGHNIESSSFHGNSGYEVRDGTSMAAPIVAGAIALLLSENPTMTQSEAVGILTRTSKHITHQRGSETYSHPIVRLPVSNCPVRAAEDIEILEQPATSTSATPSATPSLSPTPSESSSPTPSPTSSVSPTPSGTPSVTPSASPSMSPTPSPTASATPSATPSMSPTPSSTPSATPSVSPSVSPTPSQTASATPSATASPSPTPSNTPSVTPSVSPSMSPTPSPTASASPSATPSLSPTPSSTPSATPSASPSVSPTPSQTASATPSATASASPTPSSTPGVTPSASPSMSPTPSQTASATPSATASVSPTPSSTPSATPAESPSMSPSPSQEASATPSATASISPTSSSTPSATPAPLPKTSPSPSQAASATPSATPSTSPTPSNTETAKLGESSSTSPSPSQTVSANSSPTASVSPTTSSQAPSAEPRVTASTSPSASSTVSPLPGVAAAVPSSASLAASATSSPSLSSSAAPSSAAIDRAIPSASPLPVLNIFVGSPETDRGPTTQAAGQSNSPAPKGPDAPTPVENETESGPSDRSNDRSHGSSSSQTTSQPPAVLNIDVSDGKLPPIAEPSLQVQSGNTPLPWTARDNGLLSIAVSGPGTFCKPLLFRVPQHPLPKVFLSLRADDTRDAELYGGTALSVSGMNSTGAEVCIEVFRNWPVGYPERIMNVQWLASSRLDRTGSVTFDLVRPTYMERVCERVILAGEGARQARVGPISVLHTVEWVRPLREDHSIVSWVEESQEGSFSICITDVDPVSSVSLRDGSVQVSWMLTSASGGSVAARPSGRKRACVEVDLAEASRRAIAVSTGYGKARNMAVSRNGAAVAWIERQESTLFVACVKRLDNSIPGDENVDLFWDAAKTMDTNL